MRKPSSADISSRPTAPGTIEPDVLYSKAEFMLRSGFREAAMRAARRRGLRILYGGGRSFVLGSDFIKYLNLQQAESQPD